MSDLHNLIVQFLNSPEKNLQCDFFSRNQIVLQIYKLNDVRRWGFGIENCISDDMVIELTFNKNKVDNLNNKKRFVDSELFEKFQKFDKIKEDSYWIGIDSNQNIDFIESNILEIINTVYDLGGQKIDFVLNAY